MKKCHDLSELLGRIKTARARLEEEFGIREIAVFGSFVRGAQRRGSDIDIFVAFEPGQKTFENFMDAKFFLEKIVGGKVDLLIKESIRAELRSRIFEEAVYA
jgi:uncharacterized protein